MTTDISRLDEAAEIRDLDPDDALRLYRTMVRIRTFETKTEQLFMAGEVPGFVHLSIGQEASAAGVCAALDTADYITSTHRGHGHTLAKGAPVNGMMAELFGRTEGLCHGRGGSMHIAEFSVGILGANAIVAGGLGIAAGAGLSAKLLGSGRITASFFGDGATARGPFHEALNLASVWQLPVVFVCENNGWGSTTRSAEALAVPAVADRAAAYAMPGVTVDGNDVFAVYSAARNAVQRARDGGGPTLLETETYRLRGHYVGDPTKYRDADELTSWNERDPLVFAARKLIALEWLDEARRQEIQREADAEIDAAVEFARDGTDPDPASVADYLYAELPDDS